MLFIDFMLILQKIKTLNEKKTLTRLNFLSNAGPFDQLLHLHIQEAAREMPLLSFDIVHY